MINNSVELMRMSTYERLSYRIIEFSGLVESSAIEKIESMCQCILSSETRDVIFSLSNVTLISNTVIDHLLFLAQKFSALNGNLFVMNVNPDLKNKTQILEKLRKIQYVTCEEEAECAILTQKTAYCF
ncbi:MAG: STAS domain-containing protein [Fibrobacterota bacterium]